MQHVVDRFQRALGVKISPCYEALLTHHNEQLSSDPLFEPGWIPGLGNADFAVGTTQTFRAMFSDFPKEWVIIGMEGKRTIEKIGETIDVYVALDMRNDRIHLVDSLGKSWKGADHFRDWLAHKLARALWERTHESHLFVIGDKSEAVVQRLREELVLWHRRGVVQLEGMLVLYRDAQGKLISKHLQHADVKETAVGGIVGLLVGSLLLHPVVGAALGTLTGAAVGSARFSLSHVGLDDEFIQQLACAVPPGTWALLVVVRRAKIREMVETLKKVGGTVLVTSLSKRGEERLRGALAAAASDGAS
ncbi:MAG: DUF1269 domain-containing protein [Desulfosoma sp.]|uniref:DUF1269 domain-containing protein n=1 Tax=Desulfosoma sp. TaxID=2603217 RepID=UPI00404B4DB8